jgi:IS5 family transposase
MQYRKARPQLDVFSMLSHEQAVTQAVKGINKLSKVIGWEFFRDELESVLGYAQRDWSKGGRPPFDPVLMFKVLVLQKFHGLSDEKCEIQVKDRFSFMKFLVLQPGDAIPDARTIWDFKQALERDGRNGAGRLFERFDQMLTDGGMIGRKGSIVDASFVDEPRQRNRRKENEQIKEGERPEGFEEGSGKGRQKDCDARWAKKKTETHYGYKNHAKVDAKSKLVTKYETTGANVQDSQVFNKLVDENDEAVLADSAYLSEEARGHLLKCNCQDFIQLKGYRNHPLSEEDKKTNKGTSRIRARVEHVFGRMSQMAMDRLRTIGKERAHHHNGLTNLVYNMDRFAFLMR